MRAVLPHVVDAEALRCVVARRDRLAEIERDHRQRGTGLEQERRVTGVLGHPQEFLGQLPGRDQRALGEVEPPQPDQHREQLRGIPGFQAQLPGTTVGADDLGRGIPFGHHQRHPEGVLECELQSDTLETAGQRSEQASPWSR